MGISLGRSKRIRRTKRKKRGTMGGLGQGLNGGSEPHRRKARIKKIRLKEIRRQAEKRAPSFESKARVKRLKGSGKKRKKRARSEKWQCENCTRSGNLET